MDFESKEISIETIYEIKLTQEQRDELDVELLTYELLTKDKDKPSKKWYEEQF